MLVRVAQSTARLTQEPEIPGSIPGPVTCFCFSSSADSGRAVVSYWRRYVHEVLVNRLEGLSLAKKSVVRLTGRPGMILAVYVDVKQQHNTSSAGSFSLLR